MTRMTGPDCAVMCNLINTHTHILIKELAIRRVQHRSETYSNDSQHLAEGTEVARLRRRFSFVSPLSRLIRGFRSKYDLPLEGSKRMA